MKTTFFAYIILIEKKYIPKKPIDENSNSIYKTINREGFHRVKVTPIYKTKNYKKDYNNINPNENDNIQDEENYLEDNNQNATKEDNNSFNIK